MALPPSGFWLPNDNGGVTAWTELDGGATRVSASAWRRHPNEWGWGGSGICRERSGLGLDGLVGPGQCGQTESKQWFDIFELKRLRGFRKF